MSRIEAIKSYLAPRLRLARMEFKSGIKEAREINRENNVFKDIKQLVSDIREESKNGDVFTAGISQNTKAKEMIDTSKSGLKAFAKTNNINITFYEPTAKEEVGFGAFEKPIEISVYSKGGVFGNNYVESRMIDGDTDKITKHVTNKTFKNGDISRTVESEKEENFLQRAYRAVSEMADRIEIKKYEDKHSGLWG